MPSPLPRTHGPEGKIIEEDDDAITTKLSLRQDQENAGARDHRRQHTSTSRRSRASRAENPPQTVQYAPAPAIVETLLPVETEYEWEYDYVEVIERIENIEYYEIPIQQEKIVEIPVEVIVRKEVPVEEEIWEEVEEVRMEYKVVEKQIEVPTIKEVEVIHWNEIMKEVPSTRVETVIEEKLVERPVLVNVPGEEIRYVYKEVPFTKIVQRETIEEVEEEIEVIKKVEVRRTKIIEKIIEVPKIVMEYVDKEVKVEVANYIHEQVERIVPSEPHIVEVYKEIEIPEYEDTTVYEEIVQWKTKEVERIVPEITEVEKIVEVIVDEPQIREEIFMTSQKSLVEHPETGELIPKDEFEVKYPDYEIIED